MSTTHSEAENLKNILENIHHPELLDGHLWASRLFVKDALSTNPQLRKESPGQQLSAALGELFSKTMPSTPPRRGKRLDTHWGEFGILAALYFAPSQQGLPPPNSLREAWGRIDQAISFYVYGSQADCLSEQELESYRLVGHEVEVAPTSTLSDWHRKGIQRLAEAVAAREKYLADLPEGNSRLERSVIDSAGLVQDRQAHESTTSKSFPYKKVFLPVLICLLLIALALGGYKVWKIYGFALPLREDLSQLQELGSSAPRSESITEAGPLLAKSRQDFDLLSNEVEPVLWLGPWLRWVPVYGGDLASSRQILNLADLLLQSTERTYAAAQPVLTALNRDTDLNPSRMVLLLNQAQPQLSEARQSFDQARQLRAALKLDGLSPLTRSVIEQHVDPWLPVLDEGLKIGMALPHFLGAASDGPKTYLLVAQNEDELRPTGGFITAVGTVVIQNGQVLRLTFADSGDLDNWDRPYPLAPWQLEQYMNSPVLILRDANWFPDFPTSALYVESLYAYRNSHSVDGVIAFDQHMLVLVLEALGPINVEGAYNPIDAGNVITYMRSAKSPPDGQPVPEGWSRKGFIDKITGAMLQKIFQGQAISWQELGSAFFRGLNQDHLLLQLDDPTLADVIARHGWNGAIRPEDGDYLMVVDANVGFNKTNAVVQARLSYDVDLTDPAHPVSTLTVAHQNNASDEVPCLQWGGQRLVGQENYPLDACYWNYMRVYAPSGTQLLNATPQKVPDEWMVLNHGVDGPVDVLEEEIEGLQAFGTLMVVPGGGSLMTSFQFGLPAEVLHISPDGKQINYSLKIKKQPGTLAIPITIRVHFPNGAAITSAFPGAVIEGNDLLIETDLRTDLDLEVDSLLK
ncbi:MAG TPA: DUF4012 domain-containing protein [Anaerolineales bacterium]|nr:DUF4012 domain-containing protein [Anaerolineales bacterium]